MQRSKSRVCYLNSSVRNDFERLPLLPAEKKVVKRVWASLPTGQHAHQYPADRTMIDGCVFIFRLSSLTERVVLTGVERFVPPPKGLVAVLRSYAGRLWGLIRMYAIWGR